MLTIHYTLRASRGLAAVPKAERERLIAKIRAFAAAPGARHGWAERLAGRPETRIRQGDWRAVVEADHGRGLLVVLAVEHRSEVYR